MLGTMEKPMKILAWTAGIILVLGIGIVMAHRYMLDMPGVSFAGPLPPLATDERALASVLRRHVEAIASRPHNTDHPDALEASASEIERQLRASGYAPSAQVFDADGVKVRNIEVVIEPSPGSAADAIETLVISAHYDSAGNAPGANDNGSGTAALLEIARMLKPHRMTRTRLRLVFFVNEEPPHFKSDTMGSYVYAEALAKSGEKVRGMISLECLGYFSDRKGSQSYPPPLSLTLPTTANFIAVVGALASRPFAAEITRAFRDSVKFPSVGGVAPGFLPGITWSDHWSFAEFGIPAVMITDTALFRYRHYHLPSDTPDKLDYERMARVTNGIHQMIRSMAQ
jgi:hypothetical protein